MFPKKTVNIIALVTNLAWYFGAIPFRFQKTSPPKPGLKIIVPSFTKWRYIYVRTTFSIIVSYVSFVALRLIHKVYFGDEDYTLTFAIQMGYQFFGYSMIAVIHANSIYMWKEVPRFFVHYFSYFRYFKDRYGIPGENGPKCLKFLYAWLAVGILVNSQNALRLLRQPDKEHYFTSVLNDPRNASMVKRLPFMLAQFSVWTSSWPQVWTLCFHLYAYFSGLVWAVRELDIAVKSPKTMTNLRHPKTFTMEIRNLQLLHRLWQHAHEGWFCPSHKFVAVCVATLGSYGVIKLTGPARNSMGGMATITLIYIWTLFSKFGQLNDISRDMLWNWKKHPKSTKWMRKFVSSVPIFRVHIGSFYPVERMTVFTALLTVLNNTITILLL